jgi:hypothetical protein
MMEYIHALLVLIGLAFTIFCCAGAATFGIALVCLKMKWAPINITISNDPVERRYRLKSQEEVSGR